MLVEDGLWAVVSLPQGVFNPYADVKTSILFFNNTIARQTKEILFVKVENDGFDLGSQRRPIDENDLPIRLEVLKKYKKAVQENKKFNLNKDEEKFASVVKKEKIAKNGDYNLSANHYLAAIDHKNVKWPIVKLGEVVTDMKDGGTPSRKNGEYFGGKINWCVVKDIKEEIRDTVETLTELGLKNSSAKVWPVDTIIISLGATIGNVGIVKIPTATKQGLSGIVVDKTKILPKFLFYILKDKKEFIQSLATGVTIKEVRPPKLKELFSFPLPPLEVQQQIVAELDGYQKIIDGARQIADNYKPTIKIDPKWEMKKLSEISERVTKGTTPTTIGFNFQDNGINFVKIETIDDSGYFIDKKFTHINEKCNEALKRSQLKEGDVLFSIAGALGRVAVVNKDILPANTNQALAIITPKANLDPEYLAQVLRSPLIFNKLEGLKVGVAQYNISLAQVSDFEIPLPSIETQRRIVEKIREEQKIIDVNKKLIKLFGQKIKDKISELWGE